MTTRLILAGGGHAHLGVLRAWAKRRPSHLDITLVTPHEFAVYSGMAPGWMAGHYRLSDCLIDLRPLAAAAGVRLLISEIGGMDAQRRCVALADGTHLDYDVLSLNVGGETDTSLLEAAGELVVPVRPLHDFVARWPRIVQAASQSPGYRLVVAGGGAGGVELAFAAKYAFWSRAIDARVALIAGQEGILASHALKVQSLVRQRLAKEGIDVYDAMAVGAEEGVALSNGELLRADSVVAATGARPPVWLKVSRLELNAGCVAVDRHHQSVSHANVFAAGDASFRNDTPVAHSGVHAVHAGPVLAHNLIAFVEGRRLRPYIPRKHSLYLLATGPKHAVVSWGPLCDAGPFYWRVKNWIDTRFVAQFRTDSPSSTSAGDRETARKTDRRAMGRGR